VSRRILINGAGIAGPACAYWLARFGFDVTLLEIAPQLRTGGYIIDFWGAGFDIAEKMGVMPDVMAGGYRMQELRLVDKRGKRVGGFPVNVFEAVTQGRYISVPRGDLAAALYRSTPDNVERIFGDHIVDIEQRSDSVSVRLASGAVRTFDVVIGADGLHSQVRSLAFGPQAQFEHFLGFEVAAFEARGYRPRDELVYVSYSTPGKQIARFSLHDDSTLVLMVLASEDSQADRSETEKRGRLHQAFRHIGWESDAILDAMDRSDDLYFDRVSQIRMDRWTQGRIALIGDAASCPSLLAGQGSALAIIQAYVLAGELASHWPDVGKAFVRYEELLQAFLKQKQSAAEQFASSFAPKTQLGLWLRTTVTRLMRFPWIANWVLGRSLEDRISLPEYSAAELKTQAMK
jgi:2-polyprenyl-6-methoxyphenol hydroxylase-like FAD-dependent oxidoreductase